MERGSLTAACHTKIGCEKVQAHRGLGFDMISSSGKATPAEIAFEARWTEYWVCESMMQSEFGWMFLQKNDVLALQRVE